MFKEIINSSTPQKVDASFLKETLEQDKINLILNQSKKALYPCGQDYDSFVHSSLENNAPISDILKDLDRYSYLFDEYTFFKHSSPGHAAPSIIPLLPETQILGGLKVWDIRSFIGNAGAYSSLHFDWNSCPILLINLEGIKKINLYPPDASIKLQGYYNFTQKNPQNCEWQMELKPNEGVVIPPFWWHQTFYLTAAKSISLRFSPSELNLYLMQNLYPSWKFLQLFSLLPKDFLDAEVLFKSRLVGCSSAEDVFSKTEDILNQLIHFKEADHPFYKPFSIGYLNFYITN